MKSILVLAASFAVTCTPLWASDDVVNAISKQVWRQSRVVGSPDPPKPYQAVRAYAELKFDWPICAKRIPGSNQFLAINEKSSYAPANLHLLSLGGGKSSAKELLAFEGVAYDIAFHPDFKDNGYIYIGWNHRKHPQGARSIVTRYRMSPVAPFSIDKESATSIIHWDSNGHNGAALEFGLDRMLYITSGDGTVRRDIDQVGQRLDTLRAKVLRIDVDNVKAGETYSVPKDNPFVDYPGAKGETWCYGLRNPWRITVDPKTGAVWVGNNGQDAWEQIYHVKKGANYGWSVFEGAELFIADRTRGPTSISRPTFNHPHAEARSMTGGVVYYGQALPDLFGAYLYGDYSTGKIWAAKLEGDKVVWHKEIADTSLAITSFFLDAHGELLIADHRGKGQGGFYRLRTTPKQSRSNEFPRRLSQTGLFESTPELKPSPGVLPYDVNEPAWHDGAGAQRLVAIPASSADPNKIDPVEFAENNAWSFPEGTVFVQTLTAPAQPGTSSPGTSSPGTSGPRLETRLLTKQQGEWAGYTYVWAQDQQDAVLAPASGATIDWSKSAWKAPARSECMACHSRAAKYLLGATLLQLNRDFQYPASLFRSPHMNERTASQLDVFEHLNWFTLDEKEADSIKATKLPASNVANASGSGSRTTVERRARSYLHANCAHCHVLDGGGNAKIVLSWNTPLDKMGLVDTKPMHGEFGIRDAMLLAPGQPGRSILPYRLASLGGGRMPRVGSHNVDDRALILIRDWIAGLDKDSNYPHVIARLLAELREKAGGPNAEEEQAALVQRWLKTTDQAMQLSAALEDESVSRGEQRRVARLALQSGEPAIRDLFERFVPNSERAVRLGAAFDASVVLGRQGDPTRGRRLFEASATLACRNCHRGQDKSGKRFGPDLSEIAKKKLTPQKLLESIAKPSQIIDERYATFSLLTKSGKIHTGLREPAVEGQTTLRQVGGELITIADEEIEVLRRLPNSLMPDLLLKDLTAQEAADLLAFLKSLSGD